MNALRREWGAVTFVITVVVGAIAVAISLIVAGAHAPPTPPLANCPSYTPYVSQAASPSTSASASPSASATAATSASASSSASAVATPSPTAFNPALANCPTPPLPPTSTPTPSLPPGVTLPPTPTPFVPTPQFTPLP